MRKIITTVVAAIALTTVAPLITPTTASATTAAASATETTTAAHKARPFLRGYRVVYVQRGHRKAMREDVCVSGESRRARRADARYTLDASKIVSMRRLRDMDDECN